MKIETSKEVLVVRQSLSCGAVYLWELDGDNFDEVGIADSDGTIVRLRDGVRWQPASTDRFREVEAKVVVARRL